MPAFQPMLMGRLEVEKWAWDVVHAAQEAWEEQTEEASKRSRNSWLLLDADMLRQPGVLEMVNGLSSREVFRKRVIPFGRLDDLKTWAATQPGASVTYWGKPEKIPQVRQMVQGFGLTLSTPDPTLFNLLVGLGVPEAAAALALSAGLEEKRLLDTGT